jgi:putative membrane protein insertion efficiency factor
MKYIVIIFILLITNSACGAGEALRFEPWDFNIATLENSVSTGLTPSLLSVPGKMLWISVRGYRETIGAVDGDRCRMTPTCSSYSLQAIEKHGFIMGILLTVDRLLHEMDEMELAPVVMVQDEARFLDPVSANDFWWSSRGRLDKPSFVGNLPPQQP